MLLCRDVQIQRITHKQTNKQASTFQKCNYTCSIIWNQSETPTHTTFIVTSSSSSFTIALVAVLKSEMLAWTPDLSLTHKFSLHILLITFLFCCLSSSWSWVSHSFSFSQKYSEFSLVCRAGLTICLQIRFMNVHVIFMYANYLNYYPQFPFKVM